MPVHATDGKSVPLPRGPWSAARGRAYDGHQDGCYRAVRRQAEQAEKIPRGSVLGSIQIVLGVVSGVLGLIAAILQVRHHALVKAAPDKKGDHDGLDGKRKWVALTSALVGVFLVAPLTAYKQFHAESRVDPQPSAVTSGVVAILEEHMRPRELTDPKLLASAVTPFASQYEGLFIKCEANQRPIANDIRRTVFSAAHWRLAMDCQEGYRLPPGVILFVGSDASEHTIEAAAALADGLRAAGVTDLVGPVKQHDPLLNANDSKIALTIGAKK
ncbi:MAG: hypothetical protein ACRELB_14670 [Polyangiaceae bacterium]